MIIHNTYLYIYSSHLSVARVYRENTKVDYKNKVTIFNKHLITKRCKFAHTYWFPLSSKFKMRRLKNNVYNNKRVCSKLLTLITIEL